MEQILEKLPSWYQPDFNFTDNQEDYLTFLQDSFMVRSETGDAIPYRMTEYQKEFHSESILVKGSKASHILFSKARGISFTYSSLIELIMRAFYYHDTLLPIISQRFQNAKKILKVCKWLIQHCKVDAIKDGCTFLAESITILSTNTMIEPFPSANAADSIRGLRLVSGLIDEFAFQKKDRELWAAAQDCMQGDLGQWLVGSTPCGVSNLYYELVTKTKRGQTGFRFFELPVFDPTKFNPARSILEQPELVPIAPWISLKKLEEKRRADWRIFMQENMCSFLNDAESLISLTKIMACINQEEPRMNHRDTIFRKSSYQSANPIVIGIDVAELVDLFAVAAFEMVPDEIHGGVIAVEIFLDYFRGLDTPQLYEYIIDLVNTYPNAIKIRIDSGGVGAGLYAFAKQKYGHLIEGVNFAKSIMNQEKDTKENVRTLMCVNLKEVIEQEKADLLNDDMQISHLSAIDFALKVTRDKDKGHGDIFFAVALALLPSKYSFSNMPIATSMDTKPATTYKPQEMSLQDKLAWYKKSKKM